MLFPLLGLYYTRYCRRGWLIMLKIDSIILCFFISFTALSAGNNVVQTLSERESFLDSAKKDYEKKVAEIDRAAIEKLSVILRKSIASKDFKEADAAGKAIMELHKPASRDQNSAALQPQKSNGIASSSSDGNYPEGTFRKFGHHYKLLPFKMAYSDALKTCESLGGHLLNVGDSEEYTFFLDFSRKESKQIWLDLHRKEPGGEWLDWKGGKPSFVKWFEGRYNEDSHSDCTVLNINNSGADTVRLKGSKFACYVICEWEK
ncbi:MAG: hypothetical protein A2020_02780 [Lentisphaerae bacterium GWF2_45_14]|nr:MAG: hypothetical protein A2020_02780 [Lentisphaerae bacterium GWF2_45_14]